jgi:hypothetical protein
VIIMTFALQSYLQATAVQDAVVRFEWDDWKSSPALEKPDAQLVKRLGVISQRAILAFECGTAEWIVHRFGKLLDDRAPADFIAAAWAMTVSVRYAGYGKGPGWQPFAQKGWDGPVRRPVRDALNGLEIDIQQLFSEYHTDPAVGAALLVALASYVMTDPAPYSTWTEAILRRFEQLYPRDPADPLGDVVPREAVDPRVVFDPASTEHLVNLYLSTLDVQGNIFLSTPAGMREHVDAEHDFIGTPYVFDIESDRKSRLVHAGHRHR